jgi:hypothetical protein
MTDLRHRRRSTDRIEDRVRRSRERGDRAGMLIAESQLDRPCTFVGCRRGCVSHARDFGVDTRVVSR